MALANQKTFLQIQQELSETVLKKDFPNVVQDDVDQPGLTRLKQIINDAYAEVCTEKSWRWRFKDSYNFQTVIGQTAAYQMPDDCEEIVDMTIPLFQQRLWATEYSQWITNYPGQYTNYANAKPWAYILAPFAPDNAFSVYLFPAADQQYTVHMPYMLRPLPLVANTDILICPPEFQDLVIARALKRTYEFLGDPKWQTYDDSPGKATPAARRYDEMWMKNAKFAEALAYWRDIRQERSFTASLDINRVLFSYGG